MKVLFIGGTGTISGAVTSQMAAAGHEVTLLNRGNRPAPAGVETITADIHDEAAAARALAGREFDAVADFIAYIPAHLQRDCRLFRGRTRQFVFISSASAYQKPPRDFPITEATPLDNPYWQYSRDKAACEEFLRGLPADGSFPYTIVRPSHTFGDAKVPVGLHGRKGSWQVLKRMLDHKPVIIHGDGATLWTLTYNQDFARAFCGLLGNPAALGEAVHITTDEARTWQYIYETLAAALGVDLRAAFLPARVLAEAGKEFDLAGGLLGDKANCAVFDNAKIKRLVPGFSARVPLAEGLRRAVAYALAHPECQIPDPEFDAWCDRMAARAETW